MYISTNKSNYEYIRAALTCKLSKSKFFEPGPAVSLHRHELPEISRRTYGVLRSPQESLPKTNASLDLEFDEES